MNTTTKKLSTMTKAEAVELLRSDLPQWNEALRAELRDDEDFKIDLSEIKLPWGADLRGAYLRGAYLRGADLRGADLRGAYLQGADLQGAYLRGAYLRGAYLRGADLRGAYLQGAYLRGAYLQGADLRGADLRGAYLQGADLQGADLRGADLRGADLQGAYLQGAYLRGADLRGAYLQGAWNWRHIFWTQRQDFFTVLDAAPAEVTALREQLIAGHIDGSTYAGDCACLCGTIASIHEGGEALSHSVVDRVMEVMGLKPDSSRPIEVWFAPITKGDTPQVAQLEAEKPVWATEGEFRITLALSWLDEWVESRALIAKALVAS